MVNGAGSLAGAALAVGFLGITLGVTGGVINQTNRQLKGGRRRPVRRRSNNGNLQQAGIF